jgi:tRNA-2-methylthio-N6-dimethylallyladenosine synthase
MLCGQNVNSWGLDAKEKFKIRAGSNQKLPFADLIRKVHEIPGLKKLSFLSSNPFDFTEDLIDAIQLPKVDNFLHIAVQSGNNDVLKRMNRRHTIEDFISLINRIREVKPQVELGTDVIVGFPGETENQFNDTVELFKKIPFRVAFISMYSVRKGTIADKNYEDDVPLQEKKRRHAVLTKVWKENRGERACEDIKI